MRTAIALLSAILGSSAILSAQQRDALERAEILWDRDKGTLAGTVDGPADSAYRVLRAYVKSLNLAVKAEDDSPANHEFLVRRVRLVNKLGNERISKYLSCGDGMTGPNADSWYVYLTIATAFAPAGPTKSRLQMTLSAEGIDVPGGRSDRVACASTGVLEQQMVDRLKAAFPK